ncbi:MAG: hypothetical protein FWG29_03485 [Treponema sp.]|nr:hypothetical protein [Treponema sp.]
MKNTIKLIIALVAIIGFTMTACDNGSTSSGGSSVLDGLSAGTPSNDYLVAVSLSGKDLSSIIGVAGYQGYEGNISEKWLDLLYSGKDSADVGTMQDAVYAITGGTKTAIVTDGPLRGCEISDYSPGYDCSIAVALSSFTYDGEFIPAGTMIVHFEYN